MKAIIRKEVHLTPSTMRALKPMAKAMEISLKAYIERIIERHVVANSKSGNVGKYPLTLEESTQIQTTNQ